jgi:UDP-glucose 4-epimerase
MAQQLRYGRGLDNRKLKAAGFPLRYTTREAISKFAEDLRVRALRQDGGAPYRYEREVEEFLRYSPSVRRKSESTGGGSAS